MFSFPWSPIGAASRTTMSSSRVRPQSQAGRSPRAAGSSEGIEMENIQHPDMALGGIIGAPSPPSRQAWSRDNPVFEPEEEILEADWPQASPGRRSVSTASSGSSSSGSAHITRGGLYPTPTPTIHGRQQDRRQPRSCLKHILQKIRSKSGLLDHEESAFNRGLEKEMLIGAFCF